MRRAEDAADIQRVVFRLDAIASLWRALPVTALFLPLAALFLPLAVLFPRPRSLRSNVPG